jgi:nucleotide-binding universal stress UspA family protein
MEYPPGRCDDDRNRSYHVGNAGACSKVLETHGVGATFVKEGGSVAEAILKTVEEHESDLIIMGSAVDQVLRTSRRPTLICR